MRTYLLLTAIFGFGFILGGCASTPRTEGRTYMNGHWDHRTVEADGRSYPYGVWIPDGWDDRGPGIVFLHGYGECGTDGQKQLTVGLPRSVKEDPESWPFVVIAPQKPDGASQWEDHADAVFAALDAVVKEGLVDRGRVALTGLSQGGHGTIRIGAMHPERFRAVAPVCGYTARPPEHRTGKAWTDPESAELDEVSAALATVPVWIFHGARDDVVPPEEALILEAAIQRHEGDVQMTMFPLDNHNSWDSAYTLPEFNRWLIEKTR